MCCTVWAGMWLWGCFPVGLRSRAANWGTRKNTPISRLDLVSFWVQKTLHSKCVKGVWDDSTFTPSLPERWVLWIFTSICKRWTFKDCVTMFGNKYFICKSLTSFPTNVRPLGSRAGFHQWPRELTSFQKEMFWGPWCLGPSSVVTWQQAIPTCRNLSCSSPAAKLKGPLWPKVDKGWLLVTKTQKNSSRKPGSQLRKEDQSEN